MQNEVVSYEVEGREAHPRASATVDREMDELVLAARGRERRSIGVLVGFRWSLCSWGSAFRCTRGGC